MPWLFALTLYAASLVESLFGGGGGRVGATFSIKCHGGLLPACKISIYSIEGHLYTRCSGHVPRPYKDAIKNLKEVRGYHPITSSTVVA